MNIDNVASFQGTYSGSTTYAQGDIVAYNSSSYVSLINNNTGNQPDTNPSDWTLLAAQGPVGPAGPGTRFSWSENSNSISMSLSANNYYLVELSVAANFSGTYSINVSGASLVIPMSGQMVVGTQSQKIVVGIYGLTSAGTLSVSIDTGGPVLQWMLLMVTSVTE